MAAAPDPIPLLPLALGGVHSVLATPVGNISLYQAQPEGGAGSAPVLLLIHSVNAAGSAAEVAPLYDHYRSQRVVVAMELPGYGFSDRSDRPYLPRLMTDAVHAVVAHLRAAHGGAPVDVLALSLSSEFAARASVEAPGSIGRLALVSPTGFIGKRRRYGPAGANRGQAWLLRFFSREIWVRGVYRTLTRPGVIRYFLERTWGSRAIDETLYRYCVLTTRQPGARHAPLYFLSAYLFSADINALYEALTCPVWMSMATRGDFTDYRGRDTVQDRANWHIHRMEGGALPYFEDLPTFLALLDPFWQAQQAAD
jgi:pimeloyl-ACP methyl ester carboxylesterase